MMQHSRRIRSSFPACLLLAAWASTAAPGCYSDHYLGAVQTPLTDDPAGGSGSGGGHQDFSLAPELGAPDVTMDAELDISRMGYSDVAGIGDVDGDGYADFAAIGADNLHTYEVVHIRYGGPRPQSFTDTLELSEGGVRLALAPGLPPIEAVVPAGDVDGDGYADFMVGLGRCNTFSDAEGAYLVYGAPERPLPVASLADVGVLLKRVTPQAGPSGESCSRRINRFYFAGVGDVDGDGKDDLMFSEPAPDGEGFGAYLLYGRAERFVTGTSWADADARFSADLGVTIEPIGDVNADGMADVVLGQGKYSPTGSLWLPGRAARLAGDLDLATVAAPFMAARAAGDLDGDGVGDILLYDGVLGPHLFYGEPGLFDDGVDLSAAAATFAPYAGQSASLLAIQDRDGDGDDELVVRTYPIEDGPTAQKVYELDMPWRQGVALFGGSAAREAGEVNLPSASAVNVSAWGKSLEMVYSVGDLDGDGASDLVTQASTWYAVENQLTFGNAPVLEIRYGTPGGVSVPLY